VPCPPRSYEALNTFSSRLTKGLVLSALESPRQFWRNPGASHAHKECLHMHLHVGPYEIVCHVRKLILKASARQHSRNATLYSLLLIPSFTSIMQVRKAGSLLPVCRLQSSCQLLPCRNQPWKIQTSWRALRVWQRPAVSVSHRLCVLVEGG
jgi:hypothetical protein